MLTVVIVNRSTLRVLLRRSCSLGLTMALRMIIGVLKRAYPRVPVMTTDELQHLMKKTASQSGYRKLVLLVSKRCSTSLVFSAVCMLCIPQTSVRSFQRVHEILSLVIGLRCPCGWCQLTAFNRELKLNMYRKNSKFALGLLDFALNNNQQQPTSTVITNFVTINTVCSKLSLV